MSDFYDPDEPNPFEWPDPEPAPQRRRIPWDGGRAILYFIFTAMLSLMLGLILFDPLGFYGSIVLSEVIGFGLIPFVLSRFFNTGWERWIGAAHVNATFWFWAVLGIVAFSVAQSNLPVLIDRVYPIPEGQLVMFEEYLTADSPLKLIMIIAVIPAICEELSFRGMILSGLRKSFGARHAIIWSGFLFAVLHMSPWTFIGLWSLGCYLGYLTVRLGSVRPAILLHMINNGFALTFFYVEGKSAWREQPEFTPWYWTVAAGVVLIYAVWKIHAITAPAQDTQSRPHQGYPVQPHTFDPPSDVMGQ
jgi:membrane protease YdiL (CAAX protease family)